MKPVDVIITGLNTILPLMNDEILKVHVHVHTAHVHTVGVEGGGGGWGRERCLKGVRGRRRKVGEREGSSEKRGWESRA